MVAAENVGFKFETDLQISTDDRSFFCLMDNTETFHNKIMVVAEDVGFRLEADPLKSVRMILGMAVINNMDNMEMFHYKKLVVA